MRNNKQNSTPAVVFYPLVFISIIILSTWIYNKKQEVKPGQTWYYVLHGDNPYEKKDTLYAKIIDVKEDYVQYIETKGKRRDTLSSQVKTISSFWELKDTAN
jgi:hypothetical protein